MKSIDGRDRYGCCGPRVNPDNVLNVPCTHEWVKGPFYIKVAVTYEEPRYYSPGGLVNIEHCKKCGVLRLPKDLWDKTGENLSE